MSNVLSERSESKDFLIEGLELSYISLRSRGAAGQLSSVLKHPQLS
jgi:hypothetical protein